MITVLQIFPNYMTHGGMEAFLMNYFRNIEKTKFRFVFLQFSSKKGEFDDEILSNGGFVEYCSVNQHKFFTFRKELKKILNKYKPDIVHVHGDAFCVITLFMLKTLGVKKIIAHSHNTNQSLKSFLFLRKKMTKEFSDYHFACSKEAGLWLFGKKAIKKQNFHIIPNAIDANKFRFDPVSREKIRQELCIDRSVCLIGCFAHLVDSHKNQTFLFELLSKTNKNIKLLLIGDGVDCDYFVEMVKNLDIDDKVLFVHNISDCSKYYSAIDAFCLPSHYEGLGMVCVEAISSGLSPIISKNVPLIDELQCYEKQLDIDQTSLSRWEDEIMRSSRNENQINVVLESSYSIQNGVKKLENIYWEMLND